ncbi:hypothetical protein CCUS01_07379 [Colletotrichum cuscutae]|uniref:Uncharacterized protein n=1 Tax=Colletotrichum cuscutae TaxID=1209917 RepID=A0AAI9UXE1_9PEZI|nr:hypothetical protein CCUS01_07379 [Colletotrichum cuscutae]
MARSTYEFHHGWPLSWIQIQSREKPGAENPMASRESFGADVVDGLGVLLDLLNVAVLEDIVEGDLCLSHIGRKEEEEGQTDSEATTARLSCETIASGCRLAGWFGLGNFGLGCRSRSGSRAGSDVPLGAAGCGGAAEDRSLKRATVVVACAAVTAVEPRGYRFDTKAAACLLCRERDSTLLTPVRPRGTESGCRRYGWFKAADSNYSNTEDEKRKDEGIYCNLKAGSLAGSPLDTSCKTETAPGKHSFVQIGTPQLRPNNGRQRYYVDQTRPGQIHPPMSTPILGTRDDDAVTGDWRLAAGAGIEARDLSTPRAKVKYISRVVCTEMQEGRVADAAGTDGGEEEGEGYKVHPYLDTGRQVVFPPSLPAPLLPCLGQELRPLCDVSCTTQTAALSRQEGQEKKKKEGASRESGGGKKRPKKTMTRPKMTCHNMQWNVSPAFGFSMFISHVPHLTDDNGGMAWLILALGMSAVHRLALLPSTSKCLQLDNSILKRKRSRCDRYPYPVSILHADTSWLCNAPARETPSKTPNPRPSLTEICFHRLQPPRLVRIAKRSTFNRYDPQRNTVIFRLWNSLIVNMANQKNLTRGVYQDPQTQGLDLKNAASNQKELTNQSLPIQTALLRLTNGFSSACSLSTDTSNKKQDRLAPTASLWKAPQVVKCTLYFALVLRACLFHLSIEGNTAITMSN